MTAIVTYIRVSTAQQGKSGLGPATQRSALVQFAKTEGLELAQEFVEVESGKGSYAIERRPQLKAALAAAKKLKCAVVVAKLDRLSRDVLFISGLIAHKVPFVVARRAWMQIPSCCISAPRFAEKERSLISQQTRAALAAAKERGVVLGSAALHVARKRHRIQPGCDASRWNLGADAGEKHP